MKVIPVVSLYAGELDMLDRVKDAILVHQTNPTAIRFGQAAATLLESLILGNDLKKALESTIEFAIMGGHDQVMDACLRALSDAKTKTLEEVMLEMMAEEMGGRTCHFPAAFIVPLYIMYKAVGDGEIDQAAYEKAIRDNILAAGDTCSRAVLLGAVFGALTDKLPEEWIAKTNPDVLKKVDKAINGIVAVIN
jgi:ADP-ribosylglycohydrolase